MNSRASLPGCFLSLALLVAACAEPGSAPERELPPDALLRALRASESEGAVVLVRVQSSPREHRFDPAEVRLPRGATVRFVMAGSVPDAIAFDTAALPEHARTFLRERSAVRGPLMHAPGQLYDVKFDGAPVGRYPFGSVLHAGAGMRGVVIVGDGGDRSDDTPRGSS